MCSSDLVVSNDALLDRKMHLAMQHGCKVSKQLTKILQDAFHPCVEIFKRQDFLTESDMDQVSIIQMNNMNYLVLIWRQITIQEV